MSTKKLQILDNIIQTDSTLTQEGKAADAKIVGDMLSDITNDQIDAICGAVFYSGDEEVL